MSDAPSTDLRRALPAEVRAGLDDAAWHLPGAAPSHAGGPDWSLAEH